MGTSKHLTEDVKMKLIYAYKAVTRSSGGGDLVLLCIDLHGRVSSLRPYTATSSQKSTSKSCNTISRYAKGILKTSAVDLSPNLTQGQNPT